MKIVFLMVLSIFVLEANVNVVCKAGIMDNKSAKKYINNLLKKEPKNIECILKLANIYLKSGEILKGYKLIARAYKANPLAVEHSDIANILPYALEMTKLAKQAKKNSDKILWNRVADNFFDMGVYSEPISAYKKSLLIDPNQSEIRLKLALSYKKNNQINRAIEQLEVLLEQNEKDFYANYYLGKMLRYSLNDKENAVLHLKQAKEILSSSKDNFSDMQYPTFMNDINAELGK